MEFVGPYNTPLLYEGTDNWANQIYLYPYDTTKEKFVSLFSRSGFEAAQAGVFLPGEFGEWDIVHHHVDMGGYSGAASSMIVPEGLTVTIFSEDGQTGNRKTFIGPRKVEFYL